MKRISLTVLMLIVTIIAGVWWYVRRAANYPFPVATHGSTETVTRREQGDGHTSEEAVVLGEARRLRARSSKPWTVRLTNSLNSVELVRLMTAYRAERDPDRKHALGIQLAETGDPSLVQFFAEELFADYGRNPIPQQEGFRLCGIPRLLAVLGRRVPEARRVLIQGLDPAFWDTHISWSFEGGSATKLLVISCIEDVPVCEDEQTWEALVAFRNQESVDYLAHFSGAFIDAACTRYWMKKNGFEDTLSRSVQQRLEDIDAWYKTADGKAWLKWKESVEAQYEARRAEAVSAKP